MAMDLPQPLIFNAWIDRFRDAVLGRAGVPPADAGPGAEFVAYVLSPAGASWCGGDCTPMLSASLAAAMADLVARFGADPASWRWGGAHRAVFAHPLLSRLPLVGSLGVLAIDSPGDDSTLDRGGTGWSGFDSVHGASFRAVYDLAALDRSRFMMAPGQSGNLLSAHARDFLKRWRDGATILLGPAATSVATTVTLTPVGKP
jgi:penicillin amidase